MNSWLTPEICSPSVTKSRNLTFSGIRKVTLSEIETHRQISAGAALGIYRRLSGQTLLAPFSGESSGIYEPFRARVNLSWRLTAYASTLVNRLLSSTGTISALVSWQAVGRRPTMRTKTKKAKPKTKLGLPDLDHAMAGVLGSLCSSESKRGYRHAIDEFIGWYCSEPRLSSNKTVVMRYRIHLEDRRLAPGTINVRLAAVRRLAYEAADSGLLSPELAAGIRHVKGAKKLGVRLGNWLTAEEARALWQLPNAETRKGKRDRAVLATLLGCGLRRRELAELTLDHLQKREDIGRSSTWLGRLVTFGPSRFPTGSNT
jgi:hypothetical protein